MLRRSAPWGNAMWTSCRSWLLGLVLLVALASAGAVSRGEAASKARIDASVEATLKDFFSRVRGSRELVTKSAAVLVFPSVIRAGIGIGGEYGEGSLLTRERTVDYYNIVSGSIGFQLGAQSRSVIIVFVTPDALATFRRAWGWKAGVDASIAIINVGAGGSIDTNRIGSPVIGFIFDGTGLMFNVTLDGSKITQIRR